MKQNTNVIALIIGGVGIVYGLYSQSKMNKVADKLNSAIDTLDSNTPISISKDIVDAAMAQAVERETFIVCHKAALEASVEISANIRRQVNQEVSNKFDEISDKVSNEITNQVSRIDQAALTNKITKKAEEKIIEKFDGSLDGVLDNFNKELRNVNKIYSSIADTMTKQSRSTGVLY